MACSAVPTSSPQPVLVIMGVSGSGKTTVAKALVARLGWDFEEGDDLHPPANVAKMAAGHPLDDADRAPWLEAVGAWIRDHTAAERPGVITCSALKRRYRDVLRGPDVIFVFLSPPTAVIGDRVAARHDHFMPAALLGSQLDALEPPAPDEQSLTVSATGDPAAQVDEIVRSLGLR